MTNNQELSITHLSARIYYGDLAISEVFLLELLDKLANSLNSKILKKEALKLDPQGMIAYAVLVESHIHIHVWEEVHFLFLDLATSANVKDGFDPVKKVLTKALPKARVRLSSH